MIPETKTANARGKEINNALQAAFKEARAAYDAALREAEAARGADYISIYQNDGGRRSDVESIMYRLINHDRETCRKLYGI